MKKMLCLFMVLCLFAFPFSVFAEENFEMGGGSAEMGTGSGRPAQMSTFLTFFERVVDLFKTPITVYGFTFSFWDVYMFCLVGGLMAWFIGALNRF